MRYTTRIADQFKILLYGPDDLEYEAHPHVVPQLDVTVDDVPRIPPENLDDEPEPGRQEEQTNLTEPQAIMDALAQHAAWSSPTVLYVDEGDLLEGDARIFEASPEDYTGIEHEGLIVEIGEASSISADSLQAAERWAKRLELVRVPIHVRRLP